jgi:hypothetical protein
VVLARTTKVAAAAHTSLAGLTEDMCGQILARALGRVGGAGNVPVDLIPDVLVPEAASGGLLIVGAQRTPGSPRCSTALLS